MPADRPAASRLSTSKPRDLRHRVWTAGRMLVLGVGLVVTFGAFFLTGMRVANRAREVKVPNLTGLSLTDANRALNDAGLVLKVDFRRPDAKVAADHILSQDPDAGSILRRQRAVRVRVSDGQRDPVVPAVVGLPERTADIVLAQEKIDVADRAEIRTHAVEAGVVLAQDPAAKDRAAKVSLLVNHGEDSAAYLMPDVIGAMSSRVVDILRQHGFRVTVGSEVPYPGIPAGIVVKQSPQAGFRVAAGEAVVLEVSR